MSTPKPTPTSKATPTPTPGAGQACGPFGDAPAKFFAAAAPKCKAGKLLGPANDTAGTARYACLYEPPQASATNPLPLVVFLHASQATADSISSTNLQKMLSSADVSDGLVSAAPFPGLALAPNPGFILLAPQGRDIQQFFPISKPHGTGFDYSYRQFSPSGDVTVGGTLYPENVDAATIDAFVAQELATGRVDSNRVFVTGWGTGASMAFLYALSRPNVAAIAAYSAANPFGAFNDLCPQTPVVGMPADNSQVQIYNTKLSTDLVHNNCDLAGLCPNGESMEPELLAAGIGVQDSIIDSMQMPANGCIDMCGTNPNGDPANRMAASTGEQNFSRWPASWTPAMLDFFRSHPLTERPH